VLVRNCNINNNNAINGSAFANAAILIVQGSLISNTVIDGETGGAILNSGPNADLTLMNSTVEQTCMPCPEVLLYMNGAVSRIVETVGLERQ
jgi:hypothetical protein